MRQLPDGTYQLDGIDIASLIMGPIMILLGFLLSPFFFFAGVGLLLLTAWACSKMKVLAIIFSVVLVALIGAFNSLMNPLSLAFLVFGFGAGLLLPLIFTGAISILGITCGMKKLERLTDVASIAFHICAFITAITLSLPSGPSSDLIGFLLIFLANYLIIQFGYIIVFSVFYHAVHFTHQIGKKYFQQLKILDRYQDPDLLTEDERQKYEIIFGASPPSKSFSVNCNKKSIEKTTQEVAN